MKLKKNMYRNSFILCFALYIVILFLDFANDYNGSLWIYFIKQKKFLLLSLCSVSIEYFTPWIFLLSCISYASNYKWSYRFSGIATIISAVLIIVWNSCLSEPWRMIYSFSRELSSQKYSIMYVSMAVMIVLFPFLFCILGRNIAGKITLLICMLLISVAPSIEKLICDYNNKIYIVLRLCLFLFLFCLAVRYKYNDIKEPHFTFENKFKNWNAKGLNFILRILIAFSVLLIMLLFILFIRILPEGFIVKDLDLKRYFYFGSIEQFVKSYENPYQSDRNYMEFEYLGEKENTKQADFVWKFVVEDTDFKIDTNSYWLICTSERKLENIYYLNLLNKDEINKTVHKKELQQLQRNLSESYTRVGRIVLGNQVDNHKVYFYAVKKPEFLLSFTENVEGYDLLIDNKEIPAYFLDSLHKRPWLIVDSHTHFWGELDYDEKVHKFLLNYDTNYGTELFTKMFPVRVRQY